MVKNQFLFIVLLLFAMISTVKAQQGFTDDFSDGNFTSNPIWTGETAKFQVDVNNQLQLNDGTTTSPAYLVTSSSVISDASWEFYVEMDFAPSGSNYGEVFLVSSQQDLTQSLDGYFVRIGGISGTSDDVSLYRMDGTSEVEIIDGIDGIVGQDPVKVKVRVTKDINGQWELFADTSAALNNMVSQGTTVDVTHVQSNYFGVLCHYTSTRSDRFFFDDFVVNGQVFQDTVKPEIDTFMVNGNTQIELHFSELVDVSSALNAANYDLDPTLGNPNSVTINATDSSVVTLDYTAGFVSTTNYDLELQNIEDRNGNVIDTDTLSFYYFDPAPSIDSVVVQGNNQLEVYFSELLQVQTANATNFNADNGLGNPSSAVIDAADSSLVILDFATNFTSGTNYGLEVKNIADRNGNLMTTDTVSFFYFIPATAIYRDVVINEFYPNPSSSNGLPNGEFVEIYNASNKVFELQNWEIADGTSSRSLPSHVLQPQEYVIICNSADVAAYQAYGTVVPVSLPQLNNGGDRITLTDNNSTLIDELEYDNSWYQDASKEGGGWTIEQINPLTECSGKSNFSASNASIGGTPGTQNSVYDTIPDTTAPVITIATVIAEDSVLVSFDERIDSSSVSNATYTFNTSAIVGQVKNQAPTYQSVLILLSTPLDSGLLYTLTISGISDCEGNQINNGQVELVIPSKPQYRDVVINELFPDPTPTIGLPEAEFIELFNASDKIFDLADWSLGEVSPEDNLFPRVFKPGDYVIVCDQSDAASFQAFGNTMGLSSTPNLLNEGTQLTLFDSEGNVIDQLSYTTESYQDAVKDEGGWTLEQINPLTECSGKSNFSASNASIGGTPGTQNSVFDTLPDTSRPILETATVLSADSILLAFNERLDSVSVLNGNYSFSTSVSVASVENIYPDYDQVLLILSNPLDSGKLLNLEVTNLTDCNGNSIQNPSRVNLILPQSANANDLVINEILFNPKSGGSDFVELYNRSEKVISLKGWMMANWYDDDQNEELDSIANREIIIEEPYLVYPGDYVGLTENLSNIVKEYPNTVASNFIEVDNLPSYVDDNGGVFLLTDKNVLVDGFLYDEDQHFELLNDEDGVSLERIDPNRASDDPDNFHSAAESEGFATPGYENSQYFANTRFSGKVTINPETISPDNDGYQDVVNINYEFNAPGFVANVDIYDRSGRLIKSLVDNELLGKKGSFSWDGITEENSKARVGVYVVFFEAFNPSGDKEVFKKTLVVAAYLD